MYKSLRVIIYSIILVGLVSITLSACKKDKDDDASVGDAYHCETETMEGFTFKACCKTDQCYYEWQGKRYWCNGTDCGDAATGLVNDWFGKKKSSSMSFEQMKKQLEELRAKVGSDCDCNN